MALIEKTIEDAIKTYLTNRYGDRVYFFKTHGGPYQKRGVPDLVGCLDGHFFGFEVKKPGGKPTRQQEHNIVKIRKAGGITGVVTSTVEVMNYLRGIDNGG